MNVDSTHNPLRGAVLGCGMISEFHLRAWQRISGVEIVAIVDMDVDRAAARRDEFLPQARVYGGVGEMLHAEKLDFVDILTPPALHKMHCLAALQAGLHVICQKPMATSVSDAEELCQAASAANRILSIHENHRYRPWFCSLLELVRTDFFGAIRFLRFEQFDPREPAEPYKIQSDHGVLFEYGTHLLDLVHALLGTPQHIHARAQHLNPRVRGESLAHLTLDYPHATASVNVGWKIAGLAQGGMLLIGDAGEAIYEGSLTRSEQARFRLVRGGEIVLDETRSPLEDYSESFFLFQTQAVAALRGLGPVPQPASLNLEILRMTFAAYDSINSS